MKKSASLALSFAAFSVAALCAGYFAHKKGLFPPGRAAETTPKAAFPTEAAPLAPAQKAFDDGQLPADAPAPDDAPADLSPIFEFQLVGNEEIRA